MNDANTVPSVTLQTAVLTQIQEFVAENKDFSVVDVTRALRDKTNKGELEIPEVETDDINFQYRFEIKHDTVKSVFNELWQNGITTNGVKALNRVFNGKYFVYSPSVKFTIMSKPVTPNINSDDSTSASIQNAIKNYDNVISDAEIKRRIQLYLTNCENRGYNPSTKEVQSAIKRGNKSTGIDMNGLITMIITMGYDVQKCNTNNSPYVNL